MVKNLIQISLFCQHIKNILNILLVLLFQLLEISLEQFRLKVQTNLGYR